MSKFENISVFNALVALAAFVAFIGFAVYGYAENIIAILHTGTNGIDGVLILRVVGIFVMPLGVGLGYL